MTIEEIYHFEDISVRSYNVCINNGLNDLATLLNYYQENKTFTNLRNCGKKSSEELNALCLKYIDNGYTGILEIEKEENNLVNFISNFTRIQREIVNNFIEINLNNLSNRSKNALTLYLNGNIKIRNISEKILSNVKFNLQEIKNVGKKTIKELKDYLDSIIEFVEKVASIDNEKDLIALRNKLFLEKEFSISIIPNEILESQSIFKVVNFLISKDAIFEKNENIIFRKALKIYDEQPVLTLENIGEEINISRERVRQIRKSILENLFNNLQFIRNIEDDLYQKYNIDQNQDLINIDDDLSTLINEANNTNFSREFNTFLVYTYISKKFDLVGNIEDVLQLKYFNSSDRHNWDNFYLVNKNICNLFNFNDFTDDVNTRLCERIDESYNFNFKSYLINFSTSKNLEILNKVSEVAEKILSNEFGIYLDIDDNIRFTKNSLTQAYEYAYEALKSLRKPSKVNEITSKIEELHPDYETNDAKVRASMKRQNGFVPIGRASVFGLKEWENELENFKGGTIRSIVLEYLENQLEPKHISNIASYVLQFRPKSNEYSISQNLRLDESGNFLFFKNSLVGLQNKHYDKSYILLTENNTVEKKAWKERFSDLIQFLKQNDRLPFSSGCPKEEVKLYRWFKVQIGKLRKGDLDAEKSDQIKNVFDTYKQSTSGTKKNEYTGKKYNELITFVTEHKRLPFANKTGEENLYNFFYKQRKLYEQGELIPNQENNFIKIIKIIQSDKYENNRN